MKKIITTNQLMVLNAIPRGSETKITVGDLARITGLRYRKVLTIIGELRTLFLIPIVSDRSAVSGGVFIAMNEDERKSGMIAYEKQITSMESSCGELLKADIKNWSDNILIDVLDFSNDSDTNVS